MGAGQGHAQTSLAEMGKGNSWSLLKTVNAYTIQPSNPTPGNLYYILYYTIEVNALVHKCVCVYSRIYIYLYDYCSIISSNKKLVGNQKFINKRIAEWIMIIFSADYYIRIKT